MRRWWRRAGAVGGWVLPAVVLALVPKCPMCVMAYVAAGTGVGLSYSAAGGLREGVIWVSVGVLVVLAGRLARRAWVSRGSTGVTG
ncbi:MAG TPA: hypothetical protein VFF65_00035 [Phycisphaerales bacterium]|nr:hypothetical protein [Phycisphaerales bacterium]